MAKLEEAQSAAETGTATPNLDELRTLATRLGSLVNDPQPGLSTWQQAVGEVVDGIAEFRSPSRPMPNWPFVCDDEGWFSMNEPPPVDELVIISLSDTGAVGTAYRRVDSAWVILSPGPVLRTTVPQSIAKWMPLPNA